MRHFRHRCATGWSLLLAVEGTTAAITELSRLACEKGLERMVLGRPAREFSDYVRGTAATDVWRA
jgi:hypothetical protein